MKISRTITYAVYATLQLARESDDTPISCSELARTGHLPQRFLLQVLRRLVTQGVLRSTRGVAGGYYLSRPPAQVTLYDIFEAFDEPSDAKLPALPGFPSVARSRLLGALHEITEVTRTDLAKLSLADLLRPRGGRPKRTRQRPRRRATR